MIAGRDARYPLPHLDDDTRTFLTEDDGKNALRIRT
ncbi:hypothetical protein LPJGGPFB_04002 [Ensifer adhaerens]|uniref:Uncharacterized protein n=1 Tax=Ensifer adhaerens TaxID=106592 RepID=A0ACC5T2W2_ENSAD|nr:hypothetical protein [Ensifer adhaerens]NRP20743.1 hypothetical protein [Ensifer adhaerens]